MQVYSGAISHIYITCMSDYVHISALLSDRTDISIEHDIIYCWTSLLCASMANSLDPIGFLESGDDNLYDISTSQLVTLIDHDVVYVSVESITRIQTGILYET